MVRAVEKMQTGGCRVPLWALFREWWELLGSCKISDKIPWANPHTSLPLLPHPCEVEGGWSWGLQVYKTM